MTSSTNELISIILPVFNVEPYLEKCIESLRSQTYENIEIILVDDGSTDNSGKICDEYSLKDTRIKVSHKKNEGVSSARNLGLKLARGEYVAFIDPDDWIEPAMYENMYKTTLKYDADVCICNYIVEKPNETPRKITNPFSSVLLNKHDIADEIIAQLISPDNLENNSALMHGAVWKLLIYHRILKKHKILFPENIPFMQDKIFFIRLFLKIDFAVVDTGFHYHYFNHPNTASTKIWPDLFGLLDKVNRHIENDIKEEKVYEVYRDRLNMQMVRFSIMAVVNEAHPGNRKSLKDKLNKISSVCNSKKVQDSLAKVNINGHSYRKRMVLKSLQNNNTLFLFLYYSLATRIIDIRQKLNFKSIIR